MPGQRLTCSIGVAAGHHGELEPEHVIERADAALYKAKRGGRNRVVVDDDMASAGQPALTALRLVASAV